MPAFWKELLSAHRRGLTTYGIFTLISSLMSVFSLLMLIPFMRLLFYDTGHIESNTYFEKLFIQFISHYGKINALVVLCIIVAIVFGIKNLSRYMAQYVLSPIRSGIMQHLRNRMYRAFLEKEILSIEKLEKGKILSLFIQDVQEVEYGLIYFSEAIIKEPLLLSVTLISLLWMNWKLTIIALLLLLLSAWAIGSVLRTLKSKSISLQALQSSNNAIVSSTLQGFSIISTMMSADFFVTLFSEKQKQWRTLQNLFLQKKELASPLAEFLGICIVLTILCIGGIQVIQVNTMSPEVFITFIVVFSQIINPAKSLSTALGNLQKSSVAWSEVQHFIHDTPQNSYSTTFSTPTFNDKIVIEGLGITIEDKEIFQDVNLTINKGEHWCISGTTGSGKSSLLKCIMDILAPTKGKIILDQLPYEDIGKPYLWQIMAYIPQDGVIFPMTLKDNITLGNNCGTLQWQTAIDTVGMEDIITKQPHGWDTVLETEHITLSGGERQRIAIARTLLANKPILIMDEATSALDKNTEDKIFENIYLNYPHITLIGVTHRSHQTHLYDHWYHMKG